jgi:hypothetical protein
MNVYFKNRLSAQTSLIQMFKIKQKSMRNKVNFLLEKHGKDGYIAT